MFSSKHEFSIYSATTTQLFQQTALHDTISLHDIDLYHRITSILRLNKNDQFTLFDREINVRLLLQAINKKEIVVKIAEKNSNKNLLPHITAWIPLLKKDDMERAIYEVTAAGATTIQPLITHKSRKISDYTKEHERLIRIVNAAAEQSKCYDFALLKEPKSISIMLQELPANVPCIFGDPTGIPLFNVITQLRIKNSPHIVLLVGPEADLTNEEKNLLAEKSFIFCSLTPTILKAQQAIATLVSIMRSLI